MSSALPGWYPDPDGVEGRYRWWDGAGWTDDVGASVDARPPDPTGAEGLRSAPAPWRLLALSAGLVLFVSLGIGAGLVIWRDPADAPSRATGPMESTGRSGARTAPRGELEEKSRRASIDGATMMLPGPPYQIQGYPVRVPDLLDVLFLANASVHPGYDGRRTWSAMVGLAALEDDLTEGDLDQTGLRAVTRLCGRLFDGQHTTLKRLRAADHSVDGRAGVLVTGEVHYQVPGLPSRFDRVSALVVELDEGPVVAALSFVPNDASPELTRLAATAIGTLRVS
ncbi:MAG: DUF2510 domain-containing protein [Actinomycetes bacterium]